MACVDCVAYVGWFAVMASGGGRTRRPLRVEEYLGRCVAEGAAANLGDVVAAVWREAREGSDDLNAGGSALEVLERAGRAVREAGCWELDASGAVKGPAEAAALARGLCTPGQQGGLTTLRLSGNPGLGAAGVEAFVEAAVAGGVAPAGGWVGLSGVYVEGCGLEGEAGGRAVAALVDLMPVEADGGEGNGDGDGEGVVVNAARNRLGAAGVEALAAGALCGRPVSLAQVAQNGAGDAGAAAVAGLMAERGFAPCFLDLSGNGIGDDGAEPLLGAVGAQRGTQALVLRENPGVGKAEAVVRGLCEALGSAAGLVALDVSGCTNLLSSPTGGGSATDSVARLCRAAAESESLEILHLAGLPLTPSAVPHLVALIEAERVTELALNGSSLSAMECAEIAAAAARNRSLEVFVFDGCRGAQAAELLRSRFPDRRGVGGGGGLSGPGTGAGAARSTGEEAAAPEPPQRSSSPSRATAAPEPPQLSSSPSRATAAPGSPASLSHPRQVLRNSAAGPRLEAYSSDSGSVSSGPPTAIMQREGSRSPPQLPTPTSSAEGEEGPPRGRDAHPGGPAGVRSGASPFADEVRGGFEEGHARAERERAREHGHGPELEHSPPRTPGPNERQGRGAPAPSATPATDAAAAAEYDASSRLRLGSSDAGGLADRLRTIEGTAAALQEQLEATRVEVRWMGQEFVREQVAAESSAREAVAAVEAGAKQALINVATKLAGDFEMKLDEAVTDVYGQLYRRLSALEGRVEAGAEVHQELARSREETRLLRARVEELERRLPSHASAADGEGDVHTQLSKKTEARLGSMGQELKRISELYRNAIHKRMEGLTETVEQLQDAVAQREAKAPTVREYERKVERLTDLVKGLSKRVDEGLAPGGERPGRGAGPLSDAAILGKVKTMMGALEGRLRDSHLVGFKTFESALQRDLSFLEDKYAEVTKRTGRLEDAVRKEKEANIRALEQIAGAGGRRLPGGEDRMGRRDL